ncbi:MAG: hypothetical protein Q7J85_14815 [Bacillota bacterium]|nr:hypothetical protein [Bacillota bacterium]
MLKRHKLYEAAKTTNPERWSKGTRNWSIADEVWLNPEQTKAITKQQSVSLSEVVKVAALADETICQRLHVKAGR